MHYNSMLFKSSFAPNPFGFPMDGRVFGGEKYRFGFGGREKDDEVAGTGNTNTALYWEYDTRLGRRWNRDPKPNPSISDYVCFGNNPIMNRDIKGDTIKNTNTVKLAVANDKLRAANERLEKTKDIADNINEKFPSLAGVNNYVISKREEKVEEAQDNVNKQKDLEKSTDATINEFALTNPAEYKRLNDMPYNIHVESQYEMIQRRDNEDKKAGLTFGKTAFYGTRAGVLLTKKNASEIIDATYTFCHELGHIVDYLMKRNSSEDNANKWADENYLNIKKRKK